MSEHRWKCPDCGAFVRIETCTVLPQVRDYGDFITCPSCAVGSPAQEWGARLFGVQIIAHERARQIKSEGFTAEGDDQHRSGLMAQAAALYALPTSFRLRCKYVWEIWPRSWSRTWFKPTPDNRIRELAKAGALIAAEIERLQRVELRKQAEAGNAESIHPESKP